MSRLQELISDSSLLRILGYINITDDLVARLSSPKLSDSEKMVEIINSSSEDFIGTCMESYGNEFFDPLAEAILGTSDFVAEDGKDITLSDRGTIHQIEERKELEKRRLDEERALLLAQREDVERIRQDVLKSMKTQKEKSVSSVDFSKKEDIFILRHHTQSNKRLTSLYFGKFGLNKKQQLILSRKKYLIEREDKSGSSGDKSPTNEGYTRQN